MQRNAPREPQLAFLLRQLSASGEGTPGIEEKLQLVAAMRGCSVEAVARLDRFFIEELERLRSGLLAAQECQEKLKGLLDKLTAAPWHPAIFLGAATMEHGQKAMVLHGNARRVVSIADDVDPNSLGIGDEVLLTGELNMVMSKSPYRGLECGETGFFERYMQDGRLVLKSREEEFLVDAASGLRDIRLKTGDEVRFHRTAWLAYEKIERSKGGHLFLEEMPGETFADIGGLDNQIAELQQSIRLHLYHPDTVKKYRLQRKKAVLIWGPPGTGKTMLARALANWLGQLSKSGRSRFMNVKPAQLHSMWYSQTEANYREAFRIAQEAGEQEPEVPVVIFFDEVDSIGSARGESLHRIDDKVLNAFMAELNGLEARGNVVVVTATNRLDTLDPALVRPGRLGDLVLKIPRPNRKAARDIFGKHLPPDIPYHLDGQSSAAAREAIIESALSRIYSPNGEAELATLTFRDGKRRVVRATDLLSGAEIAKISQAATERACLREVEDGPDGVELNDVSAGVADFLETTARTLTPLNCRKHLDDLPQDVDVVRVDPIERKVRQAYRYLNVV